MIYITTTKRAVAIGSALVAVAMFAACSAPVPENGAMPTVTPQDDLSSAAATATPDSEAQMPESEAPKPESEANGGLMPDEGPRQGLMGQRVSAFDITSIDDPDKPTEAPAYSGTVVKIDGDTLTARVRAYTASSEAPAEIDDANSDRNEQSSGERPFGPAGEEKTLTLSTAFRAKMVLLSDSADDAQQSAVTTLSELTKEQLREGDRVTLWMDASGSVTYALVLEGGGPAGSGRADAGRPDNNDSQRGERPSRGDDSNGSKPKGERR